MTSNSLNKRCGVKLQAAGPPSTAVRGLSAKPSLRNGLATNPAAEHDTVTMNDVKTVAKNNCLKTQDAALFKELYFWYIADYIYFTGCPSIKCLTFTCNSPILFSSEQLDDFLWAALNYFDAFFERKLLEEKPKPMAV
jgi:hypothetical protein